MGRFEDADSTAVIGCHSVAVEQVVPPVSLVAECDIAEGIPTIASQGMGMRALVLVRMFSEPIGMLAEQFPAGGVSSSDLARAILRDFGPRLQERYVECGLSWDEQLAVDGLHPPRIPSFLASREQVMREGPQMTIAICTRDRPEGLAVLLESISNQEYQRIRVLVVDNAPTDDSSRRVVLAAARRHALEFDYVVEPRPGLSWARNRAIDTSDGEVIAWIDDDERCDRWWTAELARGFVEVPEAERCHRHNDPWRARNEKPGMV